MLHTDGGCGFRDGSINSRDSLLGPLEFRSTGVAIQLDHDSPRSGIRNTVEPILAYFVAT